MTGDRLAGEYMVKPSAQGEQAPAEATGDTLNPGPRSDSQRKKGSVAQQRTTTSNQASTGDLKQ